MDLLIILAAENHKSSKGIIFFNFPLMILIADSGSTKTAWCAIRNGDKKVYFESEGYNPFFVTPDYVKESLRRSLPDNLAPERISAVHFYGAGCQGDKIAVMQSTLQDVFSQAPEVYVEGDLLAAARALLGRKAGFVAILGTGTNTCIYDGEKITDNIDSLGFLLGDEGSGAYIGKQIISDYIRGKMPAAMREFFFQEYALTPSELMSRVYAAKLPNRYCAGFTHFLTKDNADAGYREKVVTTAFHHFFTNLVSAYPDYRQYELNCIGSIGYVFQDQLTAVAAEYGMKTGKIISSLIADLAVYHAG